MELKHKQNGNRKSDQNSQGQIGRRSEDDQESDETMFWSRLLKDTSASLGGRKEEEDWSWTIMEQEYNQYISSMEVGRIVKIARDKLEEEARTTKKAMEQCSGDWSRLLLKDTGASLAGKKEQEED